MSLFALFFVSTVIFLACHYLVAPKIARWLQHERSPRAMRINGLLAATAAVRAAALISLITSGILLAAFFLIDRYSGATAESVMGMILTLEGLRDRLMGLGADLGLFLAVLICLGMTIYAYRKGLRQMSEALNRVYQAQVASLQQKQQQGKLDPIEPTADMQAISDTMTQITEFMAKTKADSTISKDQQKEMLTASEADLSLFKQQLDTIDVLRRVNPELSAVDVELPKSRNTWERFQTFFISQGLFRCCSVSTRLVLFAFLILLIPSLLGAYSTTTTARLDHGVVRLNELRLSLEQKDAQSILDMAASTVLEQPALTVDEENVLQVMAALVEAQAISAERFGSQSLRTVSRHAISSSLARQHVLDVATARPGAAFTSTDDFVNTNWLNDSQKKILRKFDKAPMKNVPRTNFGNDIYQELHRIARRKPGFMARVKADLQNFQRPVTNLSIRSELAGDLLEGRISGLTPKQRNMVHATHHARTTRALSGYVTGKSDMGQMLARVGTADKGLETAIRASEFVELRSNFRRSYDAQVQHHNALAKNIKSRPPASIPKASMRIGNPAAKAVESMRTRQLARLGPLSRANGYADVLAKYTDYFPHRVGADTLTARGKLLSRWNPRFANSAATQVRFQRGFNFSQLRGFTRVGGVLIGQTPHEWIDSDIASDSLDIRDIHWKWDGDRIRITLYDYKDVRHETCSYDPRIAYHALVYAADGRPIAVTIVNTGLPGIRSVMLHPILVNTALGQQMIDLDNFVYDFTQGNDTVSEARKLVNQQQMLYRIAWAARMSQLTDAKLFGKEVRELLESEQQRAESILIAVLDDQLPIDELVGLALKEPSALVDPKRSPLAKMKGHFDPDLISLMADATKTKSSARMFAQFLCEHASKDWKEYEKLCRQLKGHEQLMTSDEAISEIVAEQIKYDFLRAEQLAQEIYSWVFPVPEFSEASGVREKEYAVYFNHIAFQSKPRPEQLLRFTIQLATSSHPYFDSSATDESVESTGEPWEFGNLQELVENSVQQNVQSSPEQLNILDSATEFAMLQRLFRCAFSGQLGPDFPLTKLSELAQELSDRLPIENFITPTFDFSELESYLDLAPEFQLISRIVAEAGSETLLDKMSTSQSSEFLAYMANILKEISQTESGNEQYFRMLERRLRIAAPLVALMNKTDENRQRSDRKAFDSLWSKYAYNVATWNTEWNNIRPSSLNDTDTKTALPDWLAEAYELIDLKQALNYDDDLKDAIWQLLCEPSRS